MGAGLGLPGAVPGCCSDRTSFLSPFAVLNHSAVPPSVRSLSGTSGTLLAGSGRFQAGGEWLPAPVLCLLPLLCPSRLRFCRDV